jgi:uncharacterized NAD-dependent epimerase/dehydratase family protein
MVSTNTSGKRSLCANVPSSDLELQGATPVTSLAIESPLAIFTGDLFDDLHAKTAHGVIRYGVREVVAVIDTRFAGRTAAEVVPFCRRPVPIVATVEEAGALGARAMLIGVAPAGGRLTPAWKAAVEAAMALGMDVEAGLHSELGEDPELSAAAQRHDVELRDLRAVPSEIELPRPRRARRDGVRVVHTVGSDCAIGKMSAVLELDAGARARGLRSVFVATGQTGVAISGWGIAVDHVISDFIAGAAESLVDQGAERGDLLFVEGQGALFHPAYSGVTLGLLHGSAPDALVLAHKHGTTHTYGYPDAALPTLPHLIRAYELLCAPLSGARVAAVTLNTVALADDDEARAANAAVEDETGLPCEDVARFGPDRVLDAVLAHLG